MYLLIHPPPPKTDKDKWILAERARWSRYFNVPTVSHPPKFPAMTLTVMRVICALAHLTGAPQTSAAAQRAITAAVDAFYEAHWGQARDVTDKDVIADVLGKTLPLLLPASGGGGNTSKEEAVARVLGVAGTEGKRILLENTDEAFRQGAFGLPWMVCENDRGEKEGFWGVDHMGVMLDFLGIQKPRTGPWKALL